MASNIKFFELDKYRVVDLNKEWISTIKEFKKILTRDKGSKGDVDGRKKLQAIREFTFIYHYCDYASKFGNFSEEDKLSQCIANADLPEDFNYTKDDDLVAAISKYKQLQETPALKLLHELKEGLHSSHRVIRKMRLHLEQELANLDLKDINQEEEIEEDGKSKKKKVDPITKIATALENLINISNKISPAIDSVDDLVEKVKKELGDTTNLRGNREKGHQEEPVMMPNRNEVQEDQSTGTAGMFQDL